MVINLAFGRFIVRPTTAMWPITRIADCSPSKSPSPTAMLRRDKLTRLPCLCRFKRSRFKFGATEAKMFAGTHCLNVSGETRFCTCILSAHASLCNTCSSTAHVQQVTGSNSSRYLGIRAFLQCFSASFLPTVFISHFSGLEIPTHF